MAQYADRLIPRLRLLPCLFTVILASLLLMPPPSARAAAQVAQIGQAKGDVSPLSCLGTTTVIQQSVGSIGLTYTVPFAGIMTSWQSQEIGSGTVKLKLFRATADPTQFYVAAENSASATNSGTVRSFPVRIPVEAGDLIGLWNQNSYSCTYNSGLAGDVVRGSTSDSTGPGGTATLFATAAGALANVAATIEADADHDGFGDNTQDQCPTDATKQSPCTATSLPDNTAPKLTVSGPKTQHSPGAVMVFVSSSEAATLTYGAKVGIGSGTRRKLNIATRSTALTANAKTELTLGFSNKLKKAIKKALRKRRTIAATLTLTARDAAGNQSSATRRIAIKRKRKARR